MSVLEDDIMRYFSGEGEAIYRIARRCEGSLHSYTRAIVERDRSLERDDVVSTIAEVVWRSLAGRKVREASLLYRRVQFDLQCLLRRMRVPKTVPMSAGVEEAVVDDEELFILRYQLRDAVDQLRVGPRERKAAKLLVECWPRGEIAKEIGVSHSRLRTLITDVLYPQMREALVRV